MTAPDLDALDAHLTELHELAWRSPKGLEKAIATGIVQELVTTGRSLIAEVRELTRQNAEFAGTNTSLMNDLVQMGMARDEAERQRDEARAALEVFRPMERPKEPATLLSFGYAPGKYTNKCIDCGARPWNLDKRAWRCRPCAQKRLDAALSALPPPAGSETGER